MNTQKSFLVGLVGSGIQKSLSPVMHEVEAASLGLHYVYRLLDLERLQASPDDLPALLDAAERMGFTGLNITYPCKQSVIPHLDDLSEDAQTLGAVNTVVFRDGRRIGYNTDWSGFKRSFEQGLQAVSRENVVQLGAGGAGAAVAHSACLLGSGTLTVFDKDEARAESLVQKLRDTFGPEKAAVGQDLAAAMAQADGLINATPVGMGKLPGMPLPADYLHPTLWVADVVYFPLETQLLKTAREIGCKTLDGGGMAVYQAAGAFELFTGASPNAPRMRQHFDSLVAKTKE